MQSGYQDNLSDFQKLNNTSVNITDYEINSTGLCLGSASVPRELMLSIQVNSSHHGGGLNGSCMNTAADLGEKSHASDILQENNCDTNTQNIV